VKVLPSDALGIAGGALTIVDTHLKLGGLAKISGVSLKISVRTLNVRATPHYPRPIFVT